MTTAGTGLFLAFSLVAVLSALGTVTLHSPIRAAMSLLAHIAALSGLFLLLHAHLLAALQILVYAGAVVVLFVFVIMMIGPSAPEPAVTRGMVVKTAAVAVMVLLTVLLASSLMDIVGKPLVSLAACTDAEGAECDQFGGVVAFSQSLFDGAYVPFELVSVLLTVAIIGAIAVARGRSTSERDALAKKLEERAMRTLTEGSSNVLGGGPEAPLPSKASAHGGR